MLTGRSCRGFTLIEALVALTLMLTGLAGASLMLLQSVQYERESSNRRAAIRLVASLADELRALRRDDGTPLAADAQVFIAWIARVKSALPSGSNARVDIAGANPADYRITIEWPVSGSGLQRLSQPVTT